MFETLRQMLETLLSPGLNPLSIVKSSIRSGHTSSQLSVIDNRTGRRFHVPIDHDSVQAMYFQLVGLKILDPGFLNTAVMKSKVTFIDGNRGTIRYRQHSIDSLFGRHDWEEVAHLLIWGSLPTQQQKRTFESAIAEAMSPPQEVVEAIRRLPSTSPPFAMALAGLAAHAAINPSSIPTATGNANLYIGQVETVDKAVVHTLASMAAIVALVYCHQRDREFTQPNPDKSFIFNVLLMMGFVETDTKIPSPKAVKTLEKLWVLYADHEMTNSTAAFLHVASTLTDPISCCSAYIASANGPLHGGAIDLAYNAFERLKTPDNVPALIENVKAKKQRLFGYGHRIYKTVDPRSIYIRSMMEDFHEEIKDDPLLAVAMKIDDIASKDHYFTSRNLKANADLYGCFVYTALGFEKDIIAALAMLSRMPGVLAHWREAMNQPPRLWRPQQVFVEQDEKML